MKDDKRSLREKALLQREALTDSERFLWNALITEKVLRLPEYLQSESVALYSPAGNEVATEEIRDHALRHGKRVFYPSLLKGGDPSLVRVESSRDLRPGRYGIDEPVGEEFLAERDQRELVVFVPGLVFDLQGNRLGRGGGWYDRVLHRLGGGVSRIALAFEVQVVERLAAEEWDEKVHQIVTEKRVIRCAD